MSIKGLLKKKDRNTNDGKCVKGPDTNLTSDTVWSGDDFPPSGTKVWFSPYLEDKAVFTVVGPYKDKVVIVRDDNRQDAYMAKAKELTPYDAEAERQKAISEIIAAAEHGIDEHAAGLLYDAGYQKQGGNK